MEVRLLSSALYMLDSTDLKSGIAFLHEGKPYQVLKYELIKLGRGGATVKVTVRDILSGSVTDKAFSSDLRFDEVNTYRRKLQFLYKDSSNAVFMDAKTYEQVEVPLSLIGDQILFVKEQDSVDILFWDEKPISIELSPKVEMKVVETDPGVKGNSATNIYKPALLENGVKLKVPLFINAGDKIRVDTRTKEYIERSR